jgi:hypothetical protein
VSVFHRLDALCKHYDGSEAPGGYRDSLVADQRPLGLVPPMVKVGGSGGGQRSDGVDNWARLEPPDSSRSDRSRPDKMCIA